MIGFWVAQAEPALSEVEGACIQSPLETGALAPEVIWLTPQTYL